VECDLGCLEWRTSLEDCCNPWGVDGGVGDGGTSTASKRAENLVQDLGPGHGNVGLTMENEAEMRERERSDWLLKEEQRLFQRQQKLQAEKIKHMNFLQGTSKPKTDEDRKRERREKGTNKGQKIDPLLKKVMSKVFTNKVMNETTAAYYQQAQQRDALED